jgi:hypothetical protein
MAPVIGRSAPGLSARRPPTGSGARRTRAHHRRRATSAARSPARSRRGEPGTRAAHAASGHRRAGRSSASDTRRRRPVGASPCGWRTAGRPAAGGGRTGRADRPRRTGDPTLTARPRDHATAHAWPPYARRSPSDVGAVPGRDALIDTAADRRIGSRVAVELRQRTSRPARDLTEHDRRARHLPRARLRQHEPERARRQQDDQRAQHRQRDPAPTARDRRSPTTHHPGHRRAARQDECTAAARPTPTWPRIRDVLRSNRQEIVGRAKHADERQVEVGEHRGPWVDDGHRAPPTSTAAATSPAPRHQPRNHSSSGGQLATSAQRGARRRARPALGNAARHSRRA